MSVLAEMSWENPLCPPNRRRVILANIEINNRCVFTKACADNCYLNAVRGGDQSISEQQVMEATSAMIRNGAEIRHLVAAGKEPFESPELLLRIAARFHAECEHQRPGSFGAISASVGGIRTWLPQMKPSPLDWLAVSVDAPASGMRAGDPFRVLDAAILGREAGGTKGVSVNTLYRKDTIGAVASIGKQLRGRAIDQWALAPLLQPVNGVMTSTEDFSTACEMINEAESLIDVARRVVVETELSTIQRFVGEDSWRQMGLDVWRVEVQLDSGVWLLARPPHPGFFIRLRHDGALLSKDDFTKIGLKAGRYGIYSSPEDIERAFVELQRERDDVQLKNLPTSMAVPPEALAA